MFLNPAGEPIWGGTYFPNTARYGKPAFVDVLREIARIFREEPDKIERNRAALMTRLAAVARPAGVVTIGRAELDNAARQLAGLIDPVNGGTRGAPKFPQAALFELLWRAGLRTGAHNPPPAQRRGGSANAEGVSRGGGTAADSLQPPPTPDPSPPLPPIKSGVAGGGETAATQGSSQTAPDNPFFKLVGITLDHICEGGIYDHLGGGFSRYSVDERWLTPHFEKMLYDNAQLLELLAIAHARGGRALYRRRAHETVAWLEREMITGQGAFAASLDADSEGEEGKFYVWSYDEVLRVLGIEDGEFFARHYDVTPAGNFEGHNIPNRLKPQPRSEADETRLAGLRAKLLAAREARVRPGLDDKVLADWNGLMIAALTNVGLMFGETRWIDMAARAFAFIRQQMTRGDRLGHSWRDGQLKFPGLASDFAAMIRAALTLHEATGQRSYLDQALAWQRALDRDYAHAETGAYYLTALDAEGLVVRPAATTDEATPNHNAVAAGNLIRLAVLAGDDRWREQADRLIAGIAPAAVENLYMHMALFNAVDLRLRAAEIVVTGEGERAGALLQAARKISPLDRIVLHAPSAHALPAAHPARDKVKAAAGEPQAFVCVGETCSLPVTDPAGLIGAMDAVRHT